MVDFALQIDSARLQLGDWLKVFTDNLEYQVALAVLIFITFGVWRPLRHRFWIKIGGRRPGVQTYRPEEVDDYIKKTRQSGRVACIWWAHVVFVYFAITSSLNSYQQGINHYDFPTPSYTVLSALTVGIAVWFSTRALWEWAPWHILRKRNGWNSRRNMPSQLDGWRSWEIEDKADLINRLAYPSTPNTITCWQELNKNKFEWFFWNELVDRRIPHIYQHQIPTPNSDHKKKQNRYIDFTLLNPKTGEPVLGVETDELLHTDPVKAQDDLSKDVEVEESSDIPIHRIFTVYWFRGYPMGAHDTLVKGSQKRQLRLVLRERDRIIREKQNQARLRWLLCSLRRPL